MNILTFRQNGGPSGEYLFQKIISESTDLSLLAFQIALQIGKSKKSIWISINGKSPQEFNSTNSSEGSNKLLATKQEIFTTLQGLVLKN